MKIVGVTYLDATKKSCPQELEVVYKDATSHLYTKYYVGGNLRNLIENLSLTDDQKLRDLEINAWQTGNKSVIVGNEPYHNWIPQDEYCYLLRPNPYCSWDDFENKFKLLENFTEVYQEYNIDYNRQSYTRAMLFPENKLYVGSRDFIWQHNKLYFQNNPTNDTIRSLIRLNYLDEALKLINNETDELRIINAKRYLRNKVKGLKYFKY